MYDNDTTPIISENYPQHAGLSPRKSAGPSSPMKMTAGQRARKGMKMLRQTPRMASRIVPTKTNSTVQSLIADAINITTSQPTESKDDDDTCSIVTTSSHFARTHSDEFLSNKEVRFNLSQNKTFERNPEHYLTEDIIKDCWYSNEERMVIKAAQQCILMMSFEDEHKKWQSDMQHLVQFCYQVPPTFRFTDRIMESKFQSIQSQFRGLECKAIAQLGNLKRKHLRNVLDYTSAIPSKLPSEVRDRMLAQRSIQFSRPFQLIAQVMAGADEKIATGIHKEE
jgi:hypothetical protein